MNKPIIVFTIFSIACTDVKSSSVNTDGIYLNYSVNTEGEGTGTTANALLRVGGLTSTTYVELEEGDHLYINVLEEDKELSHQGLGVIHSYSGEFVSDIVDSEFTLNFERNNLDSAPNSVATLPLGFTLTAPEEDTIISRSDDTAELVITWDNEATDTMYIEVEGSCFNYYVAEESSDTGTHSIPASYFSENETESDACEATVTVERRKVGVLDPNFGEGEVFGSQLRTAIVQIDP